MFKVNKQKEPQFFKDFKRKNKLNNWEDYDYEVKRELKSYMFKEEQGYNCPYCETVLTLDNSQIEHIKPKDKFPNALSDYFNYLVGCINKKTCGQHKGNKWDDKFINPILENPCDYITYDIMTGKVIPIAKEGIKYEKAKVTIDMLNLNDKRLCEIRKIFIEMNRYCMKYLDMYQEFPTLREWMKENIV